MKGAKKKFDGVCFVRPLNDEIIVFMMNNILKGFCKHLVMLCAVYSFVGHKIEKGFLFFSTADDVAKVG